MVFNSLKKYNIYKKIDKNIKKEIKVLRKVLKYAVKYLDIDDCYFNVIIVDNEIIKDINKIYRHKDSVTDVISFALEDERKENYTNLRLLGDIYISFDKASVQAEEYGHSLYRELSFLMIHGLLHLLGYDHMKKEDEEVMFKLQDDILDKFSF